MGDRDNEYSKSPTRNPNVQRARSFSGAKLHFSYSGKEVKTNSSTREDASRPRLPGPSPQLQRQSTFDYSHSHNTQSLTPAYPERSRNSSSVYHSPKVTFKEEISPVNERRHTAREIPNFYGGASSSSPYDTGIQSTLPYYPDSSNNISTHLHPSPTTLSSVENPALYEPRTIAHRVPNFYEGASSTSAILPSHLTKDVTLATSVATPLPSSSPHSPMRYPVGAETSQAPPPTSSYTKGYESSPYSAYSSYDPAKRVTPADTSTRIQAPPPIPIHSTLAQPPQVRRTPSPSRNTHSTAPSTDRHRRQTTVFLAPVLPQSTSLTERTSVPATRYHPPPVQASKPLSLNSQMQSSSYGPHRHNRNLTIGFSANQHQDIEKAQEEFKAERRKEEEAIRARLEAERKAEEEARLEERKRAEETARRRMIEETARLDAERLALEATMTPDEDEDVNKFIQNLQQRIKDSRDSKNSKGALVGRQINQNLAKSAENLTSALNEMDEPVEGHKTNDQVSTQSVADNSEEYDFLQQIKNMESEPNANRKKYAEHYYDFEEDDDELHSLCNSLLSTVTEEDDTTSLNNRLYLVDPQPIELQPCVISYIHNMVDGILSSLDKTDFANITDTHKQPKLYDQDLYINDADDYNYRAISETARQFFTPQSSPVEEIENDFYNDSL